MSIAVASYNVLADSYIKREYYPHTEPALLDPAWRLPALVAHVERLDADVLCLQEVERPLLDALSARLAPRGFAFEDARKAGGKPDGCATFWRRSKLERRASERLVYGDGSGHIALIVELEHEGRVLGVANTHVKWDPPGTPLEARHGIRQTGELLARIEWSRRGDCGGPVGAAPRKWVVCGDFNVTPDDELVRRFEARGLRDPFDVSAFTCNANGRRKKIDFVFLTADLAARPRTVTPIDDATPLPSRSEPSDHVALVADLGWA